jgi:hypothetical protein
MTKGFQAKHRELYDSKMQLESFLLFIESLNGEDWDDFLGRLLEQDNDPDVFSIIAPPLGNDSIMYFARLLRQASPRSIRLCGNALAVIVRRSLGLKRSKRRGELLARALSFASKLDGGVPASVFEDIAFDRMQQRQVRLLAAYGLADLHPESLNPACLGAENVQVLAPAILAAARGRNSEWLALIFPLGIDSSVEGSTSIEYSLSIALRDYEEINGTPKVGELVRQISRSSWLGDSVNYLLDNDDGLSHLKQFSVFPAGGTEDDSVEAIMTRRIREVRAGTRLARQNIWSDMKQGALGVQEALGLGQAMPPLKSLSRLAALAGEGR